MVYLQLDQIVYRDLKPSNRGLIPDHQGILNPPLVRYSRVVMVHEMAAQNLNPGLRHQHKSCFCSTSKSFRYFGHYLLQALCCVLK